MEEKKGKQLNVQSRTEKKKEKGNGKGATTGGRTKTHRFNHVKERGRKERGCIGWSVAVGSDRDGGGCVCACGDSMPAGEERRGRPGWGDWAARRSMSSTLTGAGALSLPSSLSVCTSWSGMSGAATAATTAGVCWGRTKGVRSGWSSGKMQAGSGQSRMHLSAPTGHATSSLPHKRHVCGVSVVSSSSSDTVAAAVAGENSASMGRSERTLSGGSIALSSRTQNSVLTLSPWHSFTRPLYRLHACVTARGTMKERENQTGKKQGKKTVQRHNDVIFIHTFLQVFL